MNTLLVTKQKDEISTCFFHLIIYNIYLLAIKEVKC